MKALAFLLFSVSAFCQTYQVGKADPHWYTVPGLTVGCTGTGLATDCTGYDSSTNHALYAFTFAEGYTRLLSHVPFKPDPLKALVQPTAVKYRICPHMGVKYVCVLDSRGKEGTYAFETRADDPARKAPVEYGPAPVTP